VGRARCRRSRASPPGCERTGHHPAAARAAGADPARRRGPSRPWTTPVSPCVSVGPYLDREEAGRAAARLGELGYAVRAARGGGTRCGSASGCASRGSPHARGRGQRAGARCRRPTHRGVPGHRRAGRDIVSLGVHSDAARAEGMSRRRAARASSRASSTHCAPADVAWLDVDRQAERGLPARGAAPGSGTGTGGAARAAPVPGRRTRRRPHQPDAMPEAGGDRAAGRRFGLNRPAAAGDSALTCGCAARYRIPPSPLA